MDVVPAARHQALDLLRFIDASPSPWHAVASLCRRLEAAGYQPLSEDQDWELRPGGRYYVCRGGSSLIACQLGTLTPRPAGFRIIGAHTDSPGLRVKARAAHAQDGLLRLGVEIYGSPILATFTDRDLSLAGRAFVEVEGRLESRLLRFERPLLRLPNLAIHMNRSVNEEGLKLNKQTELPLILAVQPTAGPEPETAFTALIAAAAEVPPAALKSFELAVYDTQPGCLWGPEEEFLAAARIDNLSSCHAALLALLDAPGQPQTLVSAFFDHEEIGSESHKGADGSFLSDVLERLGHGLGLAGPTYRQALARSFLVSADAAHARHPNFPNAYEPLHGVQLNQGPAVKLNCNQRYATDAYTEACFTRLCQRAAVPFQKYVHRTDLACGSTIGPMSAARLGVPTVDCGVPMWAMHSIRESAGVLDQFWLAQVLREFLTTERLD